MNIQTDSLSSRWEALKVSQPGIRIRNAAQSLGVSEAELIATLQGKGVIRLKPEFRQILSDVEKLGKVMALTRNEEVVHERKGTYLNPSLGGGPVGLFVGEDIDLRIFFKPWAFAFAVEEKSDKGSKRSLQFFAHSGYAIHKIYLTEDSNSDAWDALVEKYRETSSSQLLEIIGDEPSRPDLPDSEIDIAEFQAGWLALKDTHDFFGLLQKIKLGRIQALRLAPAGNYAVQVSPESVTDILKGASEKLIPIMAFVGNPGMIQIHTGPVRKIFEHNGWQNVMDPDFNLHVNMKGIDQVWVVRKPVAEGVVTALECFNSAGEQVLQLFGKRKPGIPELKEWQDLVQQVEVHSSLS